MANGKTPKIKHTTTGTGLDAYQVRVRRQGFPALVRTFRTYEEAEFFLHEMEHRILSGQSVLNKKMAMFTIAEALQAYQKQVPLLDDKEAGRIAQLIAEPGKIRITHFDYEALQNWSAALQARALPDPKNKKKDHYLYDRNAKRTYSAATVRKLYYTLKKVLAWHAKVNGYPFTEVFTQVSPPSTDIARTRRLEPGEWERLLAAAAATRAHPHEIQLAMGFAVETAARMGEMLKAEWHEINLAKRTWHIPKEKCKTKRARDVPLTTVAGKVLTEMQKFKAAAPETRVFHMWPVNESTLSHRFKVVTKNAEVVDFRWHDFRHEATCRLFERTQLRDVEIALITGHTDLRTLKRYANLRAADLAAMLW